MKHTKKQLQDWVLYEEVRVEGSYNMFSPNARALTGLDKDEYRYCMDNYSSLKQQAEATK